MENIKNIENINKKYYVRWETSYREGEVQTFPNKDNAMNYIKNQYRNSDNIKFEYYKGNIEAYRGYQLIAIIFEKMEK
jgi:SLT domain-containing protein